MEQAPHQRSMFGLLATAVNTAPTYHFGSNSFLLGFRVTWSVTKASTLAKSFTNFSAPRIKGIFSSNFVLREKEAEM